MSKIILDIPERLSVQLSTLPTFIDDDKTRMPEILLPKELRAEAEVLFKLNEFYCDYADHASGLESRKMKELAEDCEERLDDLQAIAVGIAKSKGKEVDESDEVAVLKEPIQWR